MRNGALLLLIFVFASLVIHAQDTVRVMHYNLLYYGVNNSFCNQTNNNLQVKNDALRKIIDFTKPEIFTVNEISSSAVYHQMILDSVLNINGVSKYQRAPITNFSSTSIVNGMFYDSEKFGITKSYALVGGDRDINVYKMFYKSPELVWSTDTVFITFIVAHLSSGTGSQNELNRDNEAALVMNHIATLPNPANFLFQGDFNLYTSAEAAFQRIINNPNANIRLYDPLNKVGSWSDNPTYAAYHTQSTHTSTNCFIGGGLDDRFDFIMTSLPVIMDTYRVQYITGSYTTLGQDGLHFNNAITDPPVNTSAPAPVIQALYDMSDHLPVYLDLKINQIPASVYEVADASVRLTFPNPVSDVVHLSVYSDKIQYVNVQIFDIEGRLVLNERQELTNSLNAIELPVADLRSGIYVMRISSESGFQNSWKIVKL